ncbi:MAG: glycosyltransferase [Candidatus Altiarchaeota archaeon]|nr:glycosyltransferase [Candidatus Altiarchaeota archaeon]
MELSIVIPAYNEEQRISDVLNNYKTLKSEIIVVADGSDKTAEIARRAGVRVLEFKERLGKGGAIIEGFKAAKGDVLSFVDCDTAVTPHEFSRLLGVFREKKCDVLVGSRRLADSETRKKQPWGRRISSRLFNYFVRAVFRLKIKDTQCGIKFFKSESVKPLLDEIKHKGFEFDVELLWRLKKTGRKIVEEPVSWQHCSGSKFSLSYGPRMCFSLLKLRLTG